MRIEIGAKSAEYMGSISTIACAVLATFVGAFIGRGPVSLLLFALALLLLIVGFTLMIRVFAAAEDAFIQRIAPRRPAVPPGQVAKATVRAGEAPQQQ